MMQLHVMHKARNLRNVHMPVVIKSIYLKPNKQPVGPPACSSKVLQFTSL